MKLQGLDAWLHCLLTDGLGPARWLALMQRWGEPEAVLAARQDDLAEILGPALARALMDTDATQPDRQAVHDWLAAGPLRQVLRLDDSDYPSGLLNTPCPPPLLFLLGRRELLQRPMLAVVGSRHASVQGAQTAESWAEALGQAGLTIVSGMAAGIDAAAHTGALRTAASSVAVIGTGIDRIYPARNQALARQLAQTGLILSEFPLGAPPLAQHFPRRNRLIAGLSQGCLVVEASLKSGSLITGRLAAEYGRDVFAVPGSIHSPQAKGCHRLIRDGAKLVDCLDDILQELRLPATPVQSPSPTPASPPADEAESRLLEAMGFDPVDADILCQRAGLTADVLSAMLLRLEMAGRLETLPGGRYQRTA